ncbi:Ypt/Rab-GAP domain of gyp1p superfamily protein [Zea mays]|uniref:Ypt/Rab-GAP domain of gyp1p superfamily protein n=1 Tax=Zea mays TaxID=4577 RepID=A0A1D6G6R7_MAIZE|nr:Ypt/Rab-GAP domain of gyp1p superfamily protein [Zea mays]
MGEKKRWEQISWGTGVGCGEGNLAQNMLRDADPCPEAPPGRRLHLQPQAPAELPTDEHQPPPLRRQQAALNRSLLRCCVCSAKTVARVPALQQKHTVAAMACVSCPLI